MVSEHTAGSAQSHCAGLSNCLPEGISWKTRVKALVLLRFQVPSDHPDAVHYSCRHSGVGMCLLLYFSVPWSLLEYLKILLTDYLCAFKWHENYLFVRRLASFTSKSLDLGPFWGRFWRCMFKYSSFSYVLLVSLCSLKLDFQSYFYFVPKRLLSK